MAKKTLPKKKVDGLVRLASLILALLVLISILWIALNGRTADVTNKDVEFDAAEKPAATVLRPETFVWPVYGYDSARRRALPAKIKPPLRPVWRYNTHQLLEFSPILVRGVLYVVGKNARIYALDARTGRRIWTRKVGKLSAASPAYKDGRIFVVTLSGRIVALDAKNGRIRWARKLGSRSESSPLVLGRSVVFGSEDGTLYRLRQRDGRIEWRYRADGAIKGGPAYADGRIFVGAYGGTVHAVRAGSGSRIWRSSTHGARFGLGSGNFYATPTVAWGRVYVGNTDGKMYSYSARTGKLGWSRGTGGYIYGAAAAANVPGRGPTIFFGSYDGHFYALNAADGERRWRHKVGGKISGAGTVVGSVVYFSTIDTTSTYGLSTRSGKRLYARSSGAYNPAISDGERIFMTGYTSVSLMVERRAFKKAARERRVALRRHERRKSSR